MNLTKKTILAIGALTFAAASFAQTAATPATPATPVGTLGHSFTDVSFGVAEIEHFSKDQYIAALSANVPVSANLDLGAGYAYSWLSGLGHLHTALASATAYTSVSGVKPFASAAVGYQWSRFSGFRDDDAIWGAAVGVEIPVGLVSLTPRVSYADDFRGSTNERQWTYSVDANYWITPRAAAYVDVGYTDISDTNVDAWTYTVGVRLKF